jgi:hypothetical protein
MGCGQLARYTKTSGNRTCLKNSCACPSHRAQISNRIQYLWDTDDTNRKEKTGKRTKQQTPEQVKARIEKHSITKRKKRIAVENTMERRSYNRRIIYHSNKALKNNKDTLNPNNLSISNTEYHLDHQVSRFVGYMLNIPIDIISHPNNLQVIPAMENTLKKHTCSKHPITLLNECDAPPELIVEVRNKLHLVKHLL